MTRRAPAVACALVPALVLFACGLLLRIAFHLAGPDGGPGWHIGFQGDAPVWQDLVQQVAHGLRDDQLRLPWRPPGMVWLVSLLWNGDAATAGLVRWTLLVLGATVAPLLWLWLRRHVAPHLALVAGCITAAASNLLLLGSGVHTEIVYLVGVLLGLLLQDRLRGPHAWLAAIGFGLLHGWLCLLRAEHTLTVGALLLVAWWLGTSWRVALVAVLATAATIAPWQWQANAMVDAYNAGTPALPPAKLPWQPEALVRLRSLPSFQQIPVQQFVTETMVARGASRVQAADLEVIREAYGCWPEPLRHGLIAIYGGLNFFLANSKEAAGGFSAAALDRAPPLQGGDTRYPPGLRRVLPQGGKIVFSYPPHLDAVVNGTQRGLSELAADPVAAAGRVAQKFWHAIEGATFGLGGYALPIGASGVRRQVDFVTADGPWPAVYRVVLLGAALAGLWSLRRTRALWPLFAFGSTKVVVVAAYFGYARQGAFLVPLVGLGLAAALAPRLPTAPALNRRWLPGLALLLLGLEATRIGTTAATVDGQPVQHGEPFGAQDFTTRRIRFE